MDEMKWIVGVDLGGSSRGALQFARWLGGRSGAGWAHAFVPVHVLHAEHLRNILRWRHLEEVIAAATAHATDQIVDASAGTAAPEVEVVQALTVEEGLEAARIRRGASGVIIGRREPGLRHHVVRLGAVARRVLRNLTCPVLVVPSDVEAWRLGEGPVVALSSLASDSLAACQVASAIATTAGRDLTVARVMPRRAEQADPAQEQRALERWMAYHGVDARSAVVLEGDVVRSTAAFAHERNAPVVVVGTRARESPRRPWSRRIARELAAVARLPVAIAHFPP